MRMGRRNSCICGDLSFYVKTVLSVQKSEKVWKNIYVLKYLVDLFAENA